MMSAAYPSREQLAVIQAAEKLMEETMARYDPSHDAYHVQRVRKTALSLARALPERRPDLLVVELAALLHDVLDKKYVSADVAADPYAFFLPLFTALAQHVDIVGSGQATLIARIVDNVSWTTEKTRRAAGQWGDWQEHCVELHCVQDADRLDAIGAFGIMRCAAFSAATNRALHVPSGAPDYDDSAIAHFYDKLLHIRDRLKTEPGKKLGEKRHKTADDARNFSKMLEFLQSIDEEFQASA